MCLCCAFLQIQTSDKLKENETAATEKGSGSYYAGELLLAWLGSVCVLKQGCQTYGLWARTGLPKRPI